MIVSSCTHAFAQETSRTCHSSGSDKAVNPQSTPFCQQNNSHASPPVQRARRRSGAHPNRSDLPDTSFHRRRKEESLWRSVINGCHEKRAENLYREACFKLARDSKTAKEKMSFVLGQARALTQSKVRFTVGQSKSLTPPEVGWVEQGIALTPQEVAFKFERAGFGHHKHLVAQIAYDPTTYKALLKLFEENLPLFEECYARESFLLELIACDRGDEYLRLFIEHGDDFCRVSSNPYFWLELAKTPKGFEMTRALIQPYNWPDNTIDDEDRHLPMGTVLIQAGISEDELILFASEKNGIHQFLSCLNAK